MTHLELMDLLRTVERPAQYLGNEVNVTRKDFTSQKLRVCLVFPDKYEIGMSYMGQKILYDILNDMDGVVAERCFAPGLDLEKSLRDNHVPLFSLESKTPLSEFDIIGISVPYELTFTNLLNILDLGGIPVWQKDRQAHHPLVITGGTGSFNPEPYADFVDAVGIGDGEEMIVDIARAVMAWKAGHGIDCISKNQDNAARPAILNQLAQIEGIYIPSFFNPVYNDEGTLREITPLKSNYTGVKKRIVADLNSQPYPTNLLLPNIQLVHDRIGIEIQRGCTRMCRFCQAGYIERPHRERSPERVLEIADQSYAKTGINEISLLSLSAGDYKTIVPTLKELNRRYADKNVSISVPATRTETLTPELIEQVKKVRKTGFTIAPEAGSERMRRVINKGNKVEDLMRACRNAFSAGYELIKFYYLCGLPFEQDEDLLGMAKEANQALSIGLEYSRRVHLNVSVSSLVPKPFTPFQWVAQPSIQENRRKLSLVRQNLDDKRLKFKFHDERMSLIEGLFARGDRRLSKVLYQAFLNGCRFDEWREHLRFDLWEKTFAETKVDLDYYIHRERNKDEILPWDHLFVQMRKEWLWNEYEAARNAAYVADCSVDKCAQFCGVCDFKTIKNKSYVIDEREVAVKKGNRDWYGRFGEVQKQTVESALVARGGGWSVAGGLDVPVSTGFKLAPVIKKLRARFLKREESALFGHLELMSTLKRAILRTGVEPTYSEGFHPQMRLSMGGALPLGMESDCEYFDLIVRGTCELEEFKNRLNSALPMGLKVAEVSWIDLHAPSIYSQMRSVFYEVSLSHSPEGVEGQLNLSLNDLNQGKEFAVTRRSAGKKERVFSLNQLVKFEGEMQAGRLRFATRLEGEAQIRPTEVVAALAGIPVEELGPMRIRKVSVEFLGVP